MSAIVIGMLCALLGLVLFGAHQPVGLIAVIGGFVSTFVGLQSRQERKALQAAQSYPMLSPPDDAAASAHLLDDQQRAAAVRAVPSLTVLAIPLQMQAGEAAVFRVRALLSDMRQLPSLAGGFVAWDPAASASDEGELYVTNRRVVFSGSREMREIGLGEIAALNTGPALVEVWRRGRPAPTRFGVTYPLELAAYIERTARDGSPAPGSIGRAGALPSGAFGLASTLISPHRVEAAAAPGENQTASGVPTLLHCTRCGAANGLSANYCQNCSAPIGPASTPTLQRG